MPVLYVDTDGTLVFGDKPYHALVEAVQQFLHENPDFELVVWSYTGEEHARKWAERLLPEWHPVIEPKDPSQAEADDILVDDKHGVGILPRDFVRRIRSGWSPVMPYGDGVPMGLSR